MEALDTLLCRYSDASFLFNQDVDTLMELLDKARDQREEDRAWQMWLMKYQLMDNKTFVPFSEFYRKLTLKISTRSAEDILAEAEEIQRSFGLIQ